MSHQDEYKTNIYVLNADGSPLMPCHSQRKVRKWIRSKKAIVVCEMPYTVQLTEQLENPQLQEVIFAEDPGPNNIGTHAIDEQGRSLIGCDVQTDNADVPKHMSKKRECRKTSRAGERKVRQRREIKLNPKSGKIIYVRKLPQCEKPIHCHTIRNSKARYCNRTRPEGWLTPTAENLVRTHVNLALQAASFLPVKKVAIEENKFDFTRLKMLSPEKWDNLVAPLAGYANAREYVSARQEGKCLLCGKSPIEEYHHVVSRKKNGSETVGNLAGLCTCCHDKVHKDRKAELSLLALMPGLEKQFDRISTLNIAMPYIIARLSELFDVCVVHGQDTKALREECGLPKSSGSFGHYVDAWCIAACALDSGFIRPSFEGVSHSYHVIRQFRRHDRAHVHAQKERTYKDASSVTVAKNRHKRTGQSCDSLEEYRGEHGDAAVSRLSVKPSKRSYKDPRRLLPGAVFYDECGYRHVLAGAKNKNTVFLSDGERFNCKRVRVVRRNTGLVFMT